MLVTMIAEGHALLIFLCLTILIMHYNHDYRSTRLKEWKQQAEASTLDTKELVKSSERLVLDDVNERTNRVLTKEKEKSWREEDLV